MAIVAAAQLDAEELAKAADEQESEDVEQLSDAVSDIDDDILEGMSVESEGASVTATAYAQRVIDSVESATARTPLTGIQEMQT